MDYDLVVLGAGATGLAAARTARKAGKRVAMVEAERPGGDCTHFGCVPSKALLESARRVQAARSGPAYGFSAAPAVDFAAVMERVRAVIADIERDESPALLKRQGIDLVQGWGTLTGPTTMQVGERTLTTEAFVVASGSRALVPPIDGLADAPYLDNTTVFSLREQPEHLLVLGGGPIGCELAQAFRRLGSQVTLVEGAPTILVREEPPAQKAITDVLTREGVAVRTGALVERVSCAGDRAGDRAGPTLHLSDGTTVSGSHLLVAVGRTPATDGIGLERAGVRLDTARRIVVDAHLQAAPTVWAAGDCASPLQFTHVGDEQGRIAAHNAGLGPAAGRLPWKRKTWDDAVVPWVTFTEPEVAHVGLTEAQAFEAYGEKARVATAWDRRGDRARTAGETDGFVRLIAVPGPVGGMALGKLVGMTVVGPMAGEQITEGALAMRAGTLVGRLAQTIHAYPTWSLGTRLAAASFFGDFGPTAARPATGPAA
jgi:pyruvate/2-oxoglutarate dehydrogenase complex dihydrolipoamide dehydrogenase (E3) component